MGYWIIGVLKVNDRGTLSPIAFEGMFGSFAWWIKVDRYENVVGIRSKTSMTRVSHGKAGDLLVQNRCQALIGGLSHSLQRWVTWDSILSSLKCHTKSNLWNHLFVDTSPLFTLTESRRSSKSSCTLALTKSQVINWQAIKCIAWKWTRFAEVSLRFHLKPLTCKEGTVEYTLQYILMSSRDSSFQITQTTSNKQRQQHCAL